MILVFLHGKGADKNAYFEHLSSLAEKLAVEFVSFNAPFESLTKKDKFLWFNKFVNGKRRDAVVEEYLFSKNYIEQEIKKLGVPLSDVVLIGHSQGGGMGVSVGLELSLGGVFSICGDLPYNLEYNCLSNTPIYWLEGVDDTYIDAERKASYKLLGDRVCYKLIKECTHTEISKAFLEIERILLKK
jgi:phospholipase/carboxylesterase